MTLAGAHVRRVDWHAPRERAALIELLDSYARDPMGGGTEIGLSGSEIVTYMKANFERAKGHRRAIDRNDPVTAPGVPPDFPNPQSLITDDCIRPTKL